VRDYLFQKVQQAEWISKCIAQRNSTLLQVAGVIVERQMKFFEKGKGGLVPLSRKETAEQLGIHESTVSRAVKGKYLQCSWGIFPLS